MKTIGFGTIVGWTISHRRAELGVSQLAFSREVKLAQSVVSRIESGLLPLTVERLSILCGALKARSFEIIMRAERIADACRERGWRVAYDREKGRKKTRATTIDLDALALLALTTGGWT